MTETVTPNRSAFTEAMSAHRQLEQALSSIGIVFPLMHADVSPLGDPRINLGPIGTETAQRLSQAISRDGTASQQ